MIKPAMNAKEFVERQLAQWDTSRLAGIYFENKRHLWRLGVSDEVAIPGKVRIHVYQPPFSPYYEDGFYFDHYDDYLVFITGHEVYHFLVYTKQIKGHHSEKLADKMGLEWLRSYRRLRFLSSAKSFFHRRRSRNV